MKLRAMPVQLIETNDGIILKRGCIEVRIGGERAAEIVQIVLSAAADGSTTEEEICSIFAAPDRPAVAYLVQQLEARRFLVPADTVDPAAKAPESSIEVFYWHFGAQAVQVTERMDSRHIAIVGVNCISRQLATSLAASGMGNVVVIDYPLLRNLRLFNDSTELMSSQWPAPLQSPLDYKEWTLRLNPEALDCLVATSDFGGLQLMREWNELCIEYHRHFLPVVLQDLIGYVGPFVVPGETACFNCFLGRQNAHLKDPRFQRATECVAFEGQSIAGFHPSMASVLGDIAAIEITKFFSGVLPMRRVGTLIEVNLLVPRLVARKVLKLPRCAVCSALNTRSSTTPAKNLFALSETLSE